MIEQYDSLVIRCPQLGGDVPFRYCRTLNEELPCRGIIGCWEFRIDISKFLEDHYSVESIQQALAPPAGTRLDVLLQLVEKAKKLKSGRE